MKLITRTFGIKMKELLIIIFVVSIANLFLMINTSDCGECDDKVVPPEDLEEKLPDPKKVKTYKFLFMYRYHGVENEPDHKLNIFTYKNILLSGDQIVFFESPNENDPVNYLLIKHKILYFIILFNFLNRSLMKPTILQNIYSQQDMILWIFLVYINPPYVLMGNSPKNINQCTQK